MNTLSPELLRHICDNFKDKKATLKAIRLVNRRLADVAAPLLFQTLLIYQTPKSWKNLSSVARCEWLAPYVVKLEIAALEYLPHYLDFMDWKSFTWDGRWEDNERQNNRAAMVSLLVEKLKTRRLRYSLNPDESMNFTDWKQCPEVCSWYKQRDQCVAGDMISELGENIETPLSEMDSALGLVYRYQRYLYWHDGENELCDLLSHSEISRLDLIPFPNLRIMSVLGSHELWKDKIWPSGRANRKLRETTDWMHLRSYVKTEHRNVLLSLTLQMLDTSAVNITRLELHRYREILANPTFPVPPLKHLQELILEFPFVENYYRLPIYEYERWELAPWLRGADDLHTLIVLSQDPEGHSNEHCMGGFFDVIALFHGIEWPKLRSIHFRETFIKPESLLRFLSEHGESLETVRIERPIFPQRKWQSIQSELFAMKFRSPDCRISMNTQDFDFQLKYATKDWFDDLEDDYEWIDVNDWP